MLCLVYFTVDVGQWFESQNSNAKILGLCELTALNNNNNNNMDDLRNNNNNNNMDDSRFQTDVCFLQTDNITDVGSAQLSASFSDSHRVSIFGYNFFFFF